MSKTCDKCGEENTDFAIRPGSVYLCSDCEKIRRAKEKKQKED